MTPKPVRREPGSTPRMRTLTPGFAVGNETTTRAAVLAAAAKASGSNARQDFVRYLDIRINVPYVVQVFQSFQQSHHQLTGLTRQRRGYRGALGHLRRRRLKTLVCQNRAHRFELDRIRQDLDGGGVVR